LKYAVLGDIHGNITALEAVLDNIDKEEVDGVIILGDILMVGPAPYEVLNKIKQINPECWISGNTDLWFDDMKDSSQKTEKEKELYQYYRYAKQKISEKDVSDLITLPVQKAININGLDVLCVHGSPRSVVEIMDHRIPYEKLEEIVAGVKEEIIVCGHSHVPFIGSINGKYVMNTGSVGRSLDGNTSASYGIIEINDHKEPSFTIKRVKYSLDENLALAKERDFPNFDKYRRSLVEAKNI